MLVPPMLELTRNTQTQYSPPMATARATYTFVGERLWLVGQQEMPSVLNRKTGGADVRRHDRRLVGERLEDL